MMTKNQKRQRKRRISLAGGQSAPQPATQGRRADLEMAEDARRAPMEARLRVAGIPMTQEAIKAAVAPSYGHDVGLCIHATVKGEDASKAWDTFSHLSASYRNYMAFYIGQTGNPQCAAITMIPEPMETDPSLRVDLRTHEEKVRAAKASWAAWEKRIASLPFPQMRWAINGTLRGFLGEGILWKDAKPTDTGRTVVAALRAMGV